MILLLAQGVRRVGESLVSLQQGEAALEAIQSSTRQLDDDVKDCPSNNKGTWVKKGPPWFPWMILYVGILYFYKIAPVRPHEKKTIEKLGFELKKRIECFWLWNAATRIVQKS